MAKVKSPKEIKVSLPEEKETVLRTIEEIQREYTTLAAKSGQVQYQVFTLEGELDMLNRQMRDLNFEAAKLKNNEVAANVQA